MAAPNDDKSPTYAYLTTGRKVSDSEEESDDGNLIDGENAQGGEGANDDDIAEDGASPDDTGLNDAQEPETILIEDEDVSGASESSYAADDVARVAARVSDQNQGGIQDEEFGPSRDDLSDRTALKYGVSWNESVEQDDSQDIAVGNDGDAHDEELGGSGQEEPSNDVEIESQSSAMNSASNDVVEVSSLEVFEIDQSDGSKGMEHPVVRRIAPTEEMEEIQVEDVDPGTVVHSMSYDREDEPEPFSVDNAADESAVDGPDEVVVTGDGQSHQNLAANMTEALAQVTSSPGTEELLVEKGRGLANAKSDASPIGREAVSSQPDDDQPSAREPTALTDPDEPVSIDQGPVNLSSDSGIHATDTVQPSVLSEKEISSSATAEPDRTVPRPVTIVAPLRNATSIIAPTSAGPSVSTTTQSEGNNVSTMASPSAVPDHTDIEDQAPFGTALPEQSPARTLSPAITDAHPLLAGNFTSSAVTAAQQLENVVNAGNSNTDITSADPAQVADEASPVLDREDVFEVSSSAAPNLALLTDSHGSFEATSAKRLQTLADLASTAAQMAEHVSSSVEQPASQSMSNKGLNLPFLSFGDGLFAADGFMPDDSKRKQGFLESGGTAEFTPTGKSSEHAQQGVTYVQTSSLEGQDNMDVNSSNREAYGVQPTPQSGDTTDPNGKQFAEQLAPDSSVQSSFDVIRESMQTETATSAFQEMSAAAFEPSVATFASLADDRPVAKPVSDVFGRENPSKSDLLSLHLNSLTSGKDAAAIVNSQGTPRNTEEVVSIAPLAATQDDVTPPIAAGHSTFVFRDPSTEGRIATASAPASSAQLLSPDTASGVPILYPENSSGLQAVRDSTSIIEEQAPKESSSMTLNADFSKVSHDLQRNAAAESSGTIPSALVSSESAMQSPVTSSTRNNESRLYDGSAAGGRVEPSASQENHSKQSPGLYCSICNVRTASVAQLAEHKAGKKHALKVQKAAIRKSAKKIAGRDEKSASNVKAEKDSQTGGTVLPLLENSRHIDEKASAERMEQNDDEPSQTEGTSNQPGEAVVGHEKFDEVQGLASFKSGPKPVSFSVRPRVSKTNLNPNAEAFVPAATFGLQVSPASPSAKQAGPTVDVSSFAGSQGDQLTKRAEPASTAQNPSFEQIATIRPPPSAADEPRNRLVPSEHASKAAEYSGPDVIFSKAGVVVSSLIDGGDERPKVRRRPGTYSVLIVRDPLRGPGVDLREGEGSGKSWLFLRAGASILKCLRLKRKPSSLVFTRIGSEAPDPSSADNPSKVIVALDSVEESSHFVSALNDLEKNTLSTSNELSAASTTVKTDGHEDGRPARSISSREQIEQKLREKKLAALKSLKKSRKSAAGSPALKSSLLALKTSKDERADVATSSGRTSSDTVQGKGVSKMPGLSTEGKISLQVTDEPRQRSEAGTTIQNPMSESSNPSSAVMASPGIVHGSGVDAAQDASVQLDALTHEPQEKSLPQTPYISKSDEDVSSRPRDISRGTDPGQIQRADNTGRPSGTESGDKNTVVGKNSSTDVKDDVKDISLNDGDTRSHENSSKVVEELHKPDATAADWSIQSGVLSRGAKRGPTSSIDPLSRKTKKRVKFSFESDDFRPVSETREIREVSASRTDISPSKNDGSSSTAEPRALRDEARGERSDRSVDVNASANIREPTKDVNISAQTAELSILRSEVASLKNTLDGKASVEEELRVVRGELRDSVNEKCDLALKCEQGEKKHSEEWNTVNQKLQASVKSITHAKNSFQAWMECGVRHIRMECRPDSYEDFIERLHTFRPTTWAAFGEIGKICPVECARHGWFNSSKNTLTSTDGAAIEFDPSVIVKGGFRAYKTEVRRVREEIVAQGHKMLSRWIGSCCPDSFCGLKPLDLTKSALVDKAENLRKFHVNGVLADNDPARFLLGDEAGALAALLWDVEQLPGTGRVILSCGWCKAHFPLIANAVGRRSHGDMHPSHYPYCAVIRDENWRRHATMMTDL